MVSVLHLVIAVSVFSAVSAAAVVAADSRVYMVSVVLVGCVAWAWCEVGDVCGCVVLCLVYGVGWVWCGVVQCDVVVVGVVCALCVGCSVCVVCAACDACVVGWL